MKMDEVFFFLKKKQEFTWYVKNDLLLFDQTWLKDACLSYALYSLSLVTNFSFWVTFVSHIVLFTVQTCRGLSDVTCSSLGFIYLLELHRFLPGGILSLNFRWSALSCFLSSRFQIQHMYRCARVQGLDTSEGLLLFGKEHFYVIDGYTMTVSREIRDIDTLPPK